MRWVVVFAGSRDQYEVPLALAESDSLEALVTDFYVPFDGFLSRAAWCLPTRIRTDLARRYKTGVNSARVNWSLMGLLSDRLLHRSQAARDNRLATLAGQRAARRMGWCGR